MKSILATCIVAALVFLAGCGDRQHFELIDRRAKHSYMVYVPKEYDDDLGVYKRAIRDVAGDPSDVCIIMFWNDRSQVWRQDQPDMSIEQDSARVAGYNRDPSSGLNTFYWLRNGDRVDVGPIE